MIIIDIEKAKNIGHDIRRQQRADEFAPLDLLISAQIPGTDFIAVEAERRAVRDKYASVQQKIDTSISPDEIKIALGI